VLWAALATYAASVLTQHNDAARTGANLQETELTPFTVKTNFGKLFSRGVEGQIYAQPLVVSGIEIPGKGVRDVVYVATMENKVYAFDADRREETEFFWKTNLGVPIPHDKIPDWFVADMIGYNIRPSIGITSTPVIDPASGRMWVVAKTFEAPEKRYFLKCLDIKTGNILKSSKDIKSTEGPAKLEAATALQRPGLLLANNMIYAAFGSHQDAGDYSGWVVSFDIDTLAQKNAFCVTPHDEGGMGGIWQSGNGPAADVQGNVYIMTGNGLFDDAKKQFSTSFVKLAPDLTLSDWFTPWNYQELTDEDLDLGSSGPMVLPESEQLVGGGKEGWLFLLDRNHMGHLQPKHAVVPALQKLKVSDHWTLTWLSWLFPSFGYHHIHGSPVYWNSAARGRLVYIWPEQTRLKAFQYDAQTHFRKKPVAKGPKAPHGMPGGFLSISANGDHDGIIWTTSPLSEDALTETVPGVMRAFDAITLKQLWGSDKGRAKEEFNFAKNCPPTVANGKVYLATFSDHLNVYGLLPSGDIPVAKKNPKKMNTHRRPGQTR
jgi:outer membrane protein assembly factor BamB